MSDSFAATFPGVDTFLSHAKWIETAYTWGQIMTRPAGDVATGTSVPT